MAISILRSNSGSCVTCHHGRGWKPTEKLRPSLRHGRGRELRGAAPGPVPRPFSAGWGLSHHRPPLYTPPSVHRVLITTLHTAHTAAGRVGDMFYCDPPPAIFKCGPDSRGKDETGRGQNIFIPHFLFMRPHNLDVMRTKNDGRAHNSRVSLMN